jgi:gliding motility-associated lipoprotein GldD
MALPRFHKIVFLIFLLSGLSCNHTYTPKPTGYPRVDFPEKTYRLYEESAPYKFEIPSYAKVERKLQQNASWWINILLPDLNGTIHISYKKIDNNLDEYIKDSRTLVYKHSAKSEGIEETPFYEEQDKRYGILYDLKGNVASAVQFFITDSTTHFLRGSLYFNTQPNRDSLNPVINFVREDIVHLIETTSWNY